MVDTNSISYVYPSRAGAVEHKAVEAGGLFGADGFSFKDVLDIINPLQQLPVVSTFYREESGADLSAASRLLGGALLGGPVGFAVALANTIVEETTGKDVGGNIIAALTGDEEDNTPALPTAKPDEPTPTHGVAARGHYSAYVRSQSLLG